MVGVGVRVSVLLRVGVGMFGAWRGFARPYITGTSMCKVRRRLYPRPLAIPTPVARVHRVPRARHPHPPHDRPAPVATCHGRGGRRGAPRRPHKFKKHTQTEPIQPKRQHKTKPRRQNATEAASSAFRRRRPAPSALAVRRQPPAASHQPAATSHQSSYLVSVPMKIATSASGM